MIFNTYFDAFNHFKSSTNQKEKIEFIETIFDHKIIKNESIDEFKIYFNSLLLNRSWICSIVNLKRLCSIVHDNKFMCEILLHLVSSGNKSKIKKLYEFMRIDSYYSKNIYIVTIYAMKSIFTYHNYSSDVEMLYDVVDLHRHVGKLKPEIGHICYVSMLNIILSKNQKKITLYTENLKTLFGYTWEFDGNNIKQSFQ